MLKIRKIFYTVLKKGDFAYPWNHLNKVRCFSRMYKILCTNIHVGFLTLFKIKCSHTSSWLYPAQIIGIGSGSNYTWLIRYRNLTERIPFEATVPSNFGIKDTRKYVALLSSYALIIGRNCIRSRLTFNNISFKTWMKNANNTKKSLLAINTEHILDWTLFLSMVW